MIKGKDLFIQEIDSKLENLEKTELFLNEIFTTYQLNQELQFNIRLTLIEAVNNSIKHGNKQDNAKTVIITCIKLGKKLRFKIQDEGSGFHYNQPASYKQLTEPNGRGVFLIKRFCDHYKTFDNGRITEIDFNI